MIVGMTCGYVYGLDAQDGSSLWNYKYYNDYPNLDSQLKHEFAVANCTSPLYKDGRIYVTSGYNHGGVMLELNDEGNGVEVAWRDDTLDCHHGGVVLVDGYIYGSNWYANNKGAWCSIDWETGETGYVHKWETKGSIVTAENLLYCYEERRGNLALVKANPCNFEIISSFRIPYGSGAHWAHPVISEGKLIIRHGESLMIYNIANNPKNP
jgi:predicted acetyltransferase